MPYTSASNYRNVQKTYSTAHFEEIEGEIVQLLENAQESVKICVAWISGRIYSTLLASLAQRKVSVEVILNDDVINARNPIERVPGILIYPLKQRSRTALMHNKFCIVDRRVLITGSYNWSRKAKEHFENVVITYNDFGLIKSFLHEFEDLKNYVEASKVERFRTCSHPGCKSKAYKLGLIGPEEGRHLESTISVWEVCVRYSHVRFEGDLVMHALHANLGLSDDEFYEPGKGFYCFEDMVRDLVRERVRIINLQNAFDSLAKQGVKAVGCVTELEPHMSIRYGHPREGAVTMLWRDIYYRKLIPSVLHDYEGETQTMIDTLNF